MLQKMVSSATVFKIGLCALLCFQNSALTLLMRYSKGVLHESYIANVSVLLVELTKIIFSILMMIKEYNSARALTARLSFVVYVSLPLAVPGLIYLIQNNLIFIALENLDSSSYSILAQGKVLFTAILSVLMLNKKLFFFQWRALLLLTIGVILVQAEAGNSSGKNKNEAENSNVFIGAAATLSVGILSSLAGVYFEKLLKNGHQMSLWERNIQLSLWGIAFGIFSTLFLSSESDWKKIKSSGPFAGFSFVTILIILMSAVGGILVAAVTKYADNIIKNFAVTVALINSSIVSYFVFHDVEFSIPFICGATTVIVSVFNYTEDVNELAKSVLPPAPNHTTLQMEPVSIKVVTPHNQSDSDEQPERASLLSTK